MADAEYAGLLADIRAHGLRDPVTLYNGQILDGRHRYRACIELGIDPPTVDFVGSDRKAQEFVLSANYDRRHLSAEQKKEIIAAELKRDPAQSDRTIAKKASVSDKTVGSVRKAKELTAEIPQLETRTGLDGKARKQVVATKTRKPSTIKAIKEHAGDRVVEQIPVNNLFRCKYSLRCSTHGTAQPWRRGASSSGSCARRVSFSRPPPPARGRTTTRSQRRWAHGC